MCLFRKKKKIFYPYIKDMKLQNALIEFKEIVDYKEPIVYFDRHNELELYARRPGILIGKAACNIAILKELVSNLNYDNIYIREITDIVPDKKWTKKDFDNANKYYMGVYSDLDSI